MQELGIKSPRRRRKCAGKIRTNNNALLEHISTETFDGGREIIQELSYGANQTFMFYSGYEFLNVALNDTMTAARYPIKQSAISVVLSGLEQIQNSGMSAMKNLIQQRVKNAESTFWNQMSAAIYSDGTGWGGKQINGLAAMISKATGVEPYFVGKPNPMMIRSALNQIDAHSETSEST